MLPVWHNRWPSIVEGDRAGLAYQACWPAEFDVLNSWEASAGELEPGQVVMGRMSLQTVSWTVPSAFRKISTTLLWLSPDTMIPFTCKTNRCHKPPTRFIDEKKVNERVICSYLQKDVTHSQTTILLGHAPTTNILHSQCAPIDSTHQSKAQPTSIRLGELYLENTALQKKVQGHLD